MATGEGRLIDVGGARAQHLLVRLALGRSRPVTVHSLLEDVWHGEAEAPVVKATVARLRNRLAGGRSTPVVVHSPGGYALAADQVDVDLWRFETLVEQAHTAMRHGDAEQAEERFGRAVALVSGPPFGGCGAPFVEAEATRLGELHLDAIEELCELRLGRRESGVTSTLATLVARHPLRERLVGQYMSALYLSGRHAEAIDAYQRHRRLLSDELGLEPGPVLARLEHAILTHSVDAAAPRYDSHRRSSAVPPLRRTPFVGRRRQLAQLTSLLASVEDRGGPVLASVVGPPSSGRTRLLSEFASVSALRGVHVLAAGATLPDAPFGALIRALQPVVDDLTPPLAQVALGELTPDAARAFPGSASLRYARQPVDEPVPAVRARRIASALATLVCHAADQRCTVLVLDDLDRCDPMVLTTLDALLDTSVRDLLVVAAVGDGESGAWVDRARTRWRVSDVALPPLDDDDIATLLREGSRVVVDDDARQAIAVATGGLPGLVAMVLDDTVAGGVGSIDEEELIAVAVRRLNALPVSIRDTLAVMALVGHSATLDLVATVLSTDEMDAAAHLEAAAWAGIVEEAPNAVDVWNFRHPAARAAAENAPSAGRRRRWHASIADVLEIDTTGPTGLVRLAHHLRAAMPVVPRERAVTATLAAADAVLVTGAAAEASALADEALAASGSDRDTVRVEALAVAAKARAAAGDGARAAEAAEEGFALGRELGAAEPLAAVIAIRHRIIPHLYDSNDATLLLETLERLPVEHPRREALELMAASQLAVSPEPERAAPLLRSLETRVNSLDYGMSSSLLHAWREYLAATGTPPYERDGLRERLRSMVAANDGPSTLPARRALLGDRFESADFKGFAAELDEFFVAAADSASPVEVWCGHVMRAAVEVATGRFDPGDEACRTALSYGEAHGVGHAKATADVQQVLSLWGRCLLGAFAGVVVEAADAFPLPAYKALAAMACALGGDQTTATRLLDDVAAAGFEVLPQDWLRLPALCFATVAAQRTGRDDHCATLSTILEQLSPRWVVIGNSIGAVGPLDRYLGLAAAGAGAHETAVAHLRTGLEKSQTAGAAMFTSIIADDLAMLGHTL